METVIEYYEGYDEEKRITTDNARKTEKGDKEMINGIFLGTGSIPTRERCCQCVLLDFDYTSVLVDCGEGTQYQLLKSGYDLSKISDIFITHEHIDHVYGIGGVLPLLLNKYPEKIVTVYAPRNVVQIIKTTVNLFMLKNRSRIEYVEVHNDNVIDRDFYVCSMFKTNHTETSLGYSFQRSGKKIVLLGDVDLPDAKAYEEIVGRINKADAAVIDGVHIAAEQAAELARDAKVKTLYLMPILLSKTEDEVINQVTSIFSDVHIPRDLEEFIVE